MRILALHGFTGSGADFEALRAASSASWQWQTLDFPGHASNAATKPADFSLNAHLREIAKALQETPADAATTAENSSAERGDFAGNFAGNGQFAERHFPASFSTPTPQLPILLGYSMGGRLALHFASRHPETISGLVLIGASPGLRTPQERAQRHDADEALAREIESAPIANFFEKWWALPLLAPMRAPALDTLRSRRLRENTPHGLAASLRAVGTGNLPSLWDTLPKLTLPVLCIAGANDSKFTAIARAMCAQLPNAAFAEIPSASHFPHFEQPAAVAATVANFAAKTPAARQAILAYGSNLGDRSANVAAAIAALDATPGINVLATSPVFETDPEGYLDQPRFLNAAGLVSTTLSPEELLATCLRIEALNGRVRSFPNAPRTLDIDLLFYEGATRSSPALSVPHPRWEQRLFVVRPLSALFALPALKNSAIWHPLREKLRQITK